MKKIYFSVMFVYLLVVKAALGFVPTFSGNSSDLDRELKRNYDSFTQKLNSHVVFQKSKAVTNPLIDYVLFLTSHSQNRSVALALDYLLKTGGPFGLARGPANEQEKVFLAASAQAIALNHRDLIQKSYTTSNHETEILRLQRMAASRKPEHPYHPQITLPERAPRLKSTQRERWQLFLGLITDSSLSTRQFAAKNINAKAKADWLNDVLLCGYLMGVVPDVEGSPPQVRGYLDDFWKNNNQWMERQHNYVQWWFPLGTVGMGDGIAPRTLETTRQTLNDHGPIKAAIKEMLAASFVRKLTFWGQKLDQSLKVVPLTPTESQKLGKPIYGNTWHENWVISTHNYLRMSRFLECLNFFGLKGYANSLYAYLEQTADAQPDGHKMKNSLGDYWSQAKESKSAF